MMRKKLALLLCLSLLIIAFSTGCEGTANKPLTPEEKPLTEEDNGMTASERRVMASKLSNITENVNGVEKATVVVSSIGMTQEGMNTNNANNQKLNNNMNNNTVTDDNDVDQRNNKSNMKMSQNQQGENYDGLVVMIGLSLTNDGENKAKEIKEEVKQEVKASDKRISQVLVTTDPNLMKRINDVAAGIIEGKPVKSFEKDVNDLSQKIKQEQPAF